MKVYYDTIIDQLVLVTIYPHSKLFIYVTDVLFQSTKKPPKFFKSLVYVGEFFSGETYEMD